MKWVQRIYDSFSSIPAVFIDGVLYFFIAVFGAALGVLTEDDAYKYVNEFLLYWLKFIAKLGLAAVTAIKMYRSTGYADHQKMKQSEGDTTVIQRTGQVK